MIQKKHQKTSKIMFVKNVTLYALRLETGSDMYPHANIQTIHK